MVGLDAKALLGGEVEALGKRLDDVRESLTALADVAEAKAKTKSEANEEIIASRTYLDSVQKVKQPQTNAFRSYLTYLLISEHKFIGQ